MGSHGTQLNPSIVRFRHVAFRSGGAIRSISPVEDEPAKLVHLSPTRERLARPTATKRHSNPAITACKAQVTSDQDMLGREARGRGAVTASP